MTAAVLERPAVRAPRLRPAPFDGPPLTLVRHRAAPPLPPAVPRPRDRPANPVQGPSIVHCRWAPISPLTRAGTVAARTGARGSVRSVTISHDATSSWWREAEPTGTTLLPEAIEWAEIVCRGLFESLAGRRPVQQLQPHCCPEVFAGITQYARAGAHPPAALISLAVCHPDDGVAEASAIFRSGGRVRALAIRLQGFNGRWRITDLEIG